MPESNENVKPEDLMNSILGKLYDTLTTGDDKIAPSKDNYLSWVTPGIPYDPKDFDFLNEGFVGTLTRAVELKEELLAKRKEKGIDVTKKESGEEGNESEESDPLFNISAEELMAQDSIRKYLKAQEIARLADMIPDTSGISGDVTMNVWNQENSLSQAYEHILMFSQVADNKLDDTTKLELERLRGLLTEKKVKINLVTQKEEIQIVDSPMVQQYFEKMTEYNTHALAYNTRRIDAMSGKDATAVHYFSMNASILYNNVRAAYKNWISNGYKEEFEQITAFIAQVEGRSMAMLKEKYKEDLKKSLITDVSSGASFYHTALFPGSFANSDKGWTEFKFNKSHFDSKNKFTEKKGGGSVRVLGYAGAGASHSNTESNTKINMSKFELTFKIAQVPISRPWFNVNYLTSQYWRFGQDNPQFKDQMVSNGDTPPDGMLPAFSTTAIFIRDLKLKVSKSDYENTFKEKITKAKGGVGWGFIRLNANYSSTEREASVDFNSESQGISMNGMQLIGFKCHVLPKSPNPNPEIKNWI